MDCIIGGYHGPNTLQHQMTQCDICGVAVCVEHKGIHWERTHSTREYQRANADYRGESLDDLAADIS